MPTQQLLPPTSRRIAFSDHVIGEDIESAFDIAVEGWETDFDLDQAGQVGITITVLCGRRVVSCHTISAADWQTLEALQA